MSILKGAYRLSKLMNNRKQLPIVLTKDEIKKVLSNLSGENWLICSLMYGAGLQPLECLKLRIGDIIDNLNDRTRYDNYDSIRIRNTIRTNSTFGDAIIPELIKEHLRDQVIKVSAIHNDFLADNVFVQMPQRLLPLQYPFTAREIRFQWLLPQELPWIAPETKEKYSISIKLPSIQKSFRDAVTKAEITKRVTCDSLRDSFAAHLFETGCNIQQVQHLMRESDLYKIIPYIAASSGLDILRSPLDET